MGAEITPKCPVSSEVFAQRETGTIIRIGGEPMIGTAVVMAGFYQALQFQGSAKCDLEKFASCAYFGWQLARS
ncbi:hypothetical protein OEG84_21820 [Hoeflea sp. G2-23]|uniref:Uncharacterized protein n=1 Tax=Hoeflea algicola TaxID=2983763 RepID=A0ABT3ZEV1_9HYPH|nr:hypothetical protein [Hoeflea algicola]MCY0150269.1 hypothetical protein [Hoeflea algicola]